MSKLYLNFPTDIDFISIDTENTELNVLKGLDLDKYNVKLLVIENNFNEPMIEEYLTKFNYIKIKRLVVNDFYIKKAQGYPFDWEFYTSFYQDLIPAGVNNYEKALNHFNYFGRNENRICNNLNIILI